MTGVATPVQPDSTTQTGSTYKGAIDGGFAVAKRLAWAFAPHEQSSPNMTVRVDAGNVLVGTTLTEIAAQNTGTITAPVTNPRIDRVVIDQATGAVSVITGTPAGSPVVPAITAGKLPVAQVLLQTSSTVITNSMITDERALSTLGLLGTLATQNANAVTLTSPVIDGTATGSGTLGGSIVVPLGRTIRTEANSGTSTSITTGTLTSISTINLGTVNAGDRIFVSAGIASSAVSVTWNCLAQVDKLSGTAVIATGNNGTSLATSAGPVNTGLFGQQISLSGYFRVTTGGTLVLAILAEHDAGVNKTYFGQIQAIVFNNG